MRSAATPGVIDNRAEPPTEAPGTQPGTLRLEIDVRDGDRAEVSIVAAPSLDDVAEALASLDQSRHTELTVIDSSGSYIAVGGGRGHYLVYMGAYDQTTGSSCRTPAPPTPTTSTSSSTAAPAGTTPATSWTSTRRLTRCANSCAVADRTPTSPGDRDALAIMIAGQR